MHYFPVILLLSVATLVSVRARSLDDSSEDVSLTDIQKLLSTMNKAQQTLIDDVKEAKSSIAKLQELMTDMESRLTAKIEGSRKMSHASVQPPSVPSSTDAESSNVQDKAEDSAESNNNDRTDEEPETDDNTETDHADSTTMQISAGTIDGSTNRAIPYIPPNARWAQNGVTIAKQFAEPIGLFIEDDQTIVVADWEQGCIFQFKRDDMTLQIVAGGRGDNNQPRRLSLPIDVLIDKKTDSFIICSRGRKNVIQWSRQIGTTEGEILIGNITCFGLAMDDQRNLYVSELQKHEVRRYTIGDKEGTLVAGGNGKGSNLNQLDRPTFIFVDQQQTLYVSDIMNNRVMKWNKGATEGIIVAGGQGQGNATNQLNEPQGLFVDTLGTLYVADSKNQRVMRWPKGATQGDVIVGGNGKGIGANQFASLRGLSCDSKGNLFVVDYDNGRVQRFDIR